MIVNVGAGDGIYAVGLALRCPRARIVAFEIDPYPARTLAAVARENRVAERVELEAAASASALAALDARDRTILICDAEGSELELIDPSSVPWIARAGLLIEVHDAFRPGVGERLAGRLAATHRLEWISPRPRYLSEHPPFWGLRGLSPSQLESLLSEIRPWPTSWLLARPQSAVESQRDGIEGGNPER